MLSLDILKCVSQCLVENSYTKTIFHLLKMISLSYNLYITVIILSLQLIFYNLAIRLHNLTATLFSLILIQYK